MQEEPQIFVFDSSSPSTSVISCKRRKNSCKRKNGSSSENIVSSMQKTIPKDNNVPFYTINPFPDPVPLKTKEKTAESSDAPSSTTALQLILISRVLKGIPQSPHFLKLKSYSKLTQEKLEAAWDEVFEDTVEKIHDLKANDFWVSARKLWRTMGELQGMGYNVIPIRRRLVEMTEVMVEFKKSKWEILMLKNKAEDHRLERSRLESMVRSFQMRVEREGRNMVRVLGEVDQMEKVLPKYEVFITNLAMKPVDVDVSKI